MERQQEHVQGVCTPQSRCSKEATSKSPASPGLGIGVVRLFGVHVQEEASDCIVSQFGQLIKRSKNRVPRVHQDAGKIELAGGQGFGVYYERMATVKRCIMPCSIKTFETGSKQGHG